MSNRILRHRQANSSSKHGRLGIHPLSLACELPTCHDAPRGASSGPDAIKMRFPGQFNCEGIVLGFYFARQPIHGLREAARAELQAEAIAQNGAGFAHGKSFGFVEVGRQSKGSWAELNTGGTDGQ